MSTRAEIIIYDGEDMEEKVRIYRHSDGYPAGVLPDLQRFLRCVEKGVIRKNAMQSAGWLIVWGFIDMHAVREKPVLDWKVGYYEPIPEGIIGDAAYRYYVDVQNIKLVVERVSDGKTEEVGLNGTCSL